MEYSISARWLKPPHTENVNQTEKLERPRYVRSERKIKLKVLSQCQRR